MSESDSLFSLFVIVPWICGIAVSTGFLQTFVAVIFPPYAWIVLAEHLLL